MYNKKFFGYLYSEIIIIDKTENLRTLEIVKTDKTIIKKVFFEEDPFLTGFITVYGWLIECVDYLNFLHSLNIYYGGCMDLNNIFFGKDKRIKIGGVNFDLQHYAPNFGMINGTIGHINDFNQLSDEQIWNDFHSLGLAFADFLHEVNKTYQKEKLLYSQRFFDPLLIRSDNFDPHELFSNLLYILIRRICP